MPTYTFRNNVTGEVYEKFLSISSLDDYKKTNPVTQIHESVPPILRSIHAKPDSGFRDVLKRIKTANRRSNINTFD